MKKNINKNYKYGVLAISGISALALTLTIIPASALADTLTRQLEFGMRGTDVSSLQTFLAQDHSVYPEALVTGYFGGMTKSAVALFQTNSNIASVGRVGPQTLPIINEQMQNGMHINDMNGPTISNVNVSSSNNVANVYWDTDENSKAVVYYSNTPLSVYEQTNSVNVSGTTAMTDTMYKMSHNVSLQNLTSNTTYYYLVYVTDQAGNVSVTWPATFRTAN